MAKGDWWMKFEINDWLNDPKLRKLSRANRDSWLTACCLMRLDGSDRLSETPADMAKMLYLTTKEFQNFILEICDKEIGDVTQSHKNVTLICRRYKKELKVKKQNRLRKKRERENKNVTLASQPIVSSKKLEVRKEEEEEGPRRPLFQNPTVVQFEEVFGRPGTAFAKQIVATVRDLGVWQTVLRDKSSYADDPQKRKGVPRWILKAYDDEILKKQANGHRNGHLPSAEEMLEAQRKAEQKKPMKLPPQRQK